MERIEVLLSGIKEGEEINLSLKKQIAVELSRLSGKWGFWHLPNDIIIQWDRNLNDPQSNFNGAILMVKSVKCYVGDKKCPLISLRMENESFPCSKCTRGSYLVNVTTKEVVVGIKQYLEEKLKGLE